MGAGSFAHANNEPPLAPAHAEARTLMSKKQWTEAGVLLRKLFEGQPRSKVIGEDLAQALLRQGRREEALSVLGRVQAVTKRSVMARLFLTQNTFQIYQDGVTFLEAGKRKQALEKFQQARESEQDNVEILLRTAQAQILEGDHDSAAELLRLAKRLDPTLIEIRLWLGRALHKRGEVAEGIVELRLAHEKLPRSEWAPIWLADAHLNLDQREQALRVLQDDLAKNPHHVRGLQLLARYRLQLRDLRGDGKLPAAAALREAQVGLSRLSDYVERPIRSETELGLEIGRQRDEMVREFEELIRQSEEIIAQRQT